MSDQVERSIGEHFSGVRDPRVLLKTRHKLTDIITITLLAVIAGAEDWVEIADFGRAKEEWLRTFLELPGGIASHDTFGRVFSLIDPAEFERCFAQWIGSLIHRPDLIAIDGKSLRRSHGAGESPLHLVNAWAVEHGLMLGQVKVDETSNEITAIPKLLEMLDLTGCVVTLDAMGCQSEIARKIVAQGADYLFCLKGNQGDLHEDVAFLFEREALNGYGDVAHDEHQTVEGDHGRIEIRHYTALPVMEGLADTTRWPGLKTVAMVKAERHQGERISHETRYFISSLPLDARRVSEAIRGHWAVENSLHWCLDIAFREDESRVRLGHAAENLAVVRRFALSLIKQDKLRKSGIKASRKRAGWDHNYLLRLISMI